MNRIFITTLFLLLTFNIFSINEKKMIMNQARQYEYRQNYSKAIRLYKIAQEKYPQDQKILQDMIRLMIRADSTKTAEKILKLNKNVLKGFTFSNLQIQLYLKKGKIEEAKNLAVEYLKNNQNNINSYATLIRVFESANQIDFAIDLIFKARKIIDDDEYLAMSLARDYNLKGEYEKSIDEYFSYLKKHKSYKFYISSLIKKIVGNSPEKIALLHKYNSNKNPSIQSVLAEVYFERKDFEEAFKHYKYTSLNEIKRFAEHLLKNKDYLNAEKVYKYIVENYSDRIVISQSNLELAKIYVIQNKIKTAQDILNKILSHKSLYSGRLKYKSSIIRDSYLLMAKIAILEDKDAEYLENIKQAKLNTYFLDKVEMDFDVINYYFAKSNFVKADTLIRKLNKKFSGQSKIMNKLTLYNFVSSFLNNKSDVDSLLTEVVLKQSENESTNEMIKYYYYLKNVSPKEKKSFFAAYFKNKIYKEKTAISDVKELYKTSKNEFYYITASEWTKNLPEKESNYFNNSTLKDTIFNNYAKYEKMKEDGNLEDMKKFLNQNPNSFITPFIRSLYLAETKSK